MIDTSKRVSKDQLSEIYTKLRKIGLIWNDPSEFNVGYLEKDNELYWRFPINPCDETLNFKEKRGNDSLKKGDLIIIDNDSIYEETNPPEKMTHSIYYERLYLIELQGLIHELKNETDEAIFNTKCLEHGFKPEYIRNIIENHKPYTLNIGKKHEIR